MYTQIIPPLDGGYVLGSRNTGGLVGENDEGKIIESYSTSDVQGYYYVGGLIGLNDGQAQNCYSNGNITGGSRVGGLIGENYYWDGRAENCYSTGHVTGTSYVGGLIGTGGSTINSYWDRGTSGQLSSSGGEGKSTTEMKTMNTYDAWRCETLWTIDEGNDYPRLKWENKPGLDISYGVFFSGGQGTLNDPYLIEKPQQLNSISTVDCLLDKHYELIADVNMVEYSGDSFNIIGDNISAFTGTFNGNYHEISNFEYITSNDQDNVGLFGYLKNNAAIRNLKMKNINIEVESNTARFTGALVGYLSDGVIENCSVENGRVNGNDYVGGLIGAHVSNVFNCYTNVEVSGADYVGGLIGGTLVRSFGGVYSGGVLNDCYSRGRVIGNTYVGGLIGTLSDYGEIYHSFTSGFVSGVTNVGGFAGRQGSNVTVSACFWDSEINPTLDGIGSGSNPEVIGETTANMMTKLTFVNCFWDFVDEDENGIDNIWRMCQDGVDYPSFFWEYSRYGDFTCPNGVGTEDLDALGQCWLSYIDLGTELNDDNDTVVSLSEIARLGAYWLRSECGSCGGIDVTGDGNVLFDDLTEVLNDWMKVTDSVCKHCDANGDEEINFEDYKILAENWLVVIE